MQSLGLEPESHPIIALYPWARLGQASHLAQEKRSIKLEIDICKIFWVWSNLIAFLKMTSLFCFLKVIILSLHVGTPILLMTCGFQHRDVHFFYHLIFLFEFMFFWLLYLTFPICLVCLVVSLWGHTQQSSEATPSRAAVTCAVQGPVCCIVLPALRLECSCFVHMY